jgi:hypothetical protein
LAGGVAQSEGPEFKPQYCQYIYIFNKIIAKNFPNFDKEMPTQVQKASRTPNRHNQNRTSP